MIADVNNNKKLNPGGRKLNISIVFIMQSYFKVLKDVKTKLYPLFHYENSQ